MSCESGNAIRICTVTETNVDCGLTTIVVPKKFGYHQILIFIVLGVKKKNPRPA